MDRPQIKIEQETILADAYPRIAATHRIVGFFSDSGIRYVIVERRQPGDEDEAP